jgi:hypothetical protein
MSKQPATPQEQPPEAAQTFDMNNPPYTEEEKAALASKPAAAEPAPAVQSQPQSQPTSQQPTQPAAGQPQPMQPGVAGMPPQYPKQGMSKGLLWGLIGGGVALVLLIIGVVVFFVFFGPPSRDDYAKAYNKVAGFNARTVREKAASSDDAEAAINELTTKVDKHLDELGKMRAMHDGDVKKAYDNLKKEYEERKPLLREYAATTVAKKEYNKNCNSRSTTYISMSSVGSGDEAGKKFDEQQGTCIKTLDKLKQSQYESIRKYAESQSQYLKELRAYYVSAVNYLKSREGSMPKVPRSRGGYLGKDINSKVSDAGTSISDAERELRQVLRAKASGSSLSDD